MYLNEGLVLRKKAPISGTTPEVLRAHARTLSELSQRTAKNLWKMGKILADAQERLASYNGGTFQQWVKDLPCLNLTMAYRLMNVYRAFSYSKLEQLDFGMSALYLLSEPSTPTPARDEAIRRAMSGEAITHTTAQQIVGQYQPQRPPLPPLPPMPPSPEYSAFERDELMPWLHDAGDPDAPQVLAGQEEEQRPVPEERREQARTSLRAVIIGAIRGTDTEDQKSLDSCVDEILGALGQRNSSIAVAARIGAALSGAPRTLGDLVAITAWVCGECLSDMERADYLTLHKRTKHLVDSISYQNGLPVFEHTLRNGQIVYSLIEDPPDCP